MNASKTSRNLIGATLLACVPVLAGTAQETGVPASGTDQAQLRWTPHRIASAPRDAGPPAAPAGSQAAPQPVASPSAPTSAAKPAASIPASPTATVGLPAGVPPVAESSNPRFAPLRQGFTGQFGDWMSANRLAGSMRTSTPSDPDSIFGVTVIRAPQGERGRPVLAQEGPQRIAMPRAGAPRGRVAMAPAYGGGEAPRFDAPAPSPRVPRERIAMNVDAIPSVMSRAPQAAALDGAAVPGRLPAAAQPPAAETIPMPAAPSTGAPSATLDMGMSGMPPDMGDPMMMDGSFDPALSGASGEGGMWMGQYPAQVHVESFYDDPYACEDDEACGCLPLFDGRVCAWMRRFGRPYYGWRWYRDFTASAGVTSFTNPTDLGLNGNYGVNEYLNWAMPFWNAFGVGWQLGARGVQSSFQPATLNIGGTSVSKGSRDQVFITTGFFTRAFEGRGLQGGAVYDYLSDGWFRDVNVAQIRSELSYVWGYHEIGYWGAHNVTEQNAVFSSGQTAPVPTTTLDLYTAFYRLHFGDANEWRVWGGASGNGDGLVGSSMRAPMSRSLALEGTFTYLIPKETKQGLIDTAGSTITYGPSAWNVSVNIVYYPARRSRRSLASPYRPLFDVADNGSLIRSLILPQP